MIPEGTVRSSGGDPVKSVDSKRRSANLSRGVAAGVLVAALSAAWYLRSPFAPSWVTIYTLTTGHTRAGMRVGSSWPSRRQLAGSLTVVTPVFYLVTHLFEGDYGAYRYFDLGLQVLCVGLFGYLIWRLTDGRWLITVGAMLAATISRDDAFAVLQVVGLIESIALAFVLLTVIAVERAYQQQKFTWLAGANGAFFLAEFSHERFIVLCPFLMLATLLAPIRFRSIPLRIGPLVPLGVAFLNYAVKAWVLHVDFFIGAGGQVEHFTVSQFLRFMKDGLQSILGYNTGPAYLSGQDAASLGVVGVVVAACFVVPLAVVGLATVGRDLIPKLRSEPVRGRKYVLALSLFLPVLGSASISFRQEFRWLYAPFLILIMGASWALAQLRASTVRAVAATIVLFAGCLTVDVYYHQYLANTYFMSAEMVADAVHSDVIDAHRQMLSSTTVFFVTSDPTFSQYDLADGILFAVYARGARMDVRYVDTVEAVCKSRSARARTLVYLVEFDSIVDATAQTSQAVRVKLSATRLWEGPNLMCALQSTRHLAREAFLSLSGTRATRRVVHGGALACSLCSASSARVLSGF